MSSWGYGIYKTGNKEQPELYGQCWTNSGISPTDFIPDKQVNTKSEIMQWETDLQRMMEKYRKAHTDKNGDMFIRIRENGALIE